MFLRLQELNFFQQVDRQIISYSENPEGELDVGKLLKHDKRCWKVTQTKKGDSLIKKKVIICDWSLSEDEVDQKKIARLEKLYHAGFNLYIWQDFSMREVKSLHEIDIFIKTIRPTHPNIILKTLAKYNLEHDEVKLLDYFTMRKLCRKDNALDAYQIIRLRDLYGKSTEEIENILKTVDDYKIGFDGYGSIENYGLGFQFGNYFKNIEYLNVSKDCLDNILFGGKNKSDDYVKKIKSLGHESEHLLSHPDLNPSELDHLSCNDPDIFSRTPNLKKLSYSGIYTRRIFKEFEDLEFLELGYQVAHTYDDIDLKFYRLDKLKTFSANIYLSRFLLSTILNHSKNLENLVLHRPLEPSGNFSLTHHTKIKYLHMYGHPEANLEILALTGKLPLLKKFVYFDTLWSDYQPQDKTAIVTALLALIKEAKDLESIRLRLRSPFQKTDPNLIVELPKLKKLSIDTPEVSSHFLWEIISKTPELTTLKITTKKINDLLNVNSNLKMQHLTKLTIQFAQVNYEAVVLLQQLLASSPHLKEIKIKLTSPTAQQMKKEISYQGLHLEKLKFECDEIPYDSKPFVFNLTEGNKLQKLTLAGKVHFKTDFKKIYKLSLNYLDMGNVSDLTKLSPSILSLKDVFDGPLNSIAWSDVKQIVAVDMDIRHLKKIAMKCSNVEELTSHVELKDIKFSSLRKLKISLETLTFKSLEDFLKINPSVHEVTIVGTGMVGVPDLSCPFWQKRNTLSMINDSGVEEKAYRLLNALKNNNLLDFKTSDPFYGELKWEDDQESDTLLVDWQTARDPNKTLHAQMYFEKKNNCSSLHPNIYRLRPVALRTQNQKFVIKTIKPEFLKHDEVREVSNTDKKVIRSIYNNQYKQSPQHFFGKYKCFLEPGEYCPLPSLDPNEHLIASGSSDPVQLHYCEKNNMWYISLKEGEVKQEVSIDFILYVEEFDNENILQHHSELRNFINYFRGFQEGSLQGVNANASPQEYLKALVKQRVGECRHRVYAALALQSKLNLPLRAMFNDIHAFIEVKYDNRWLKLDLGGYDTHLDIKQLDEQMTDDERINQILEKKAKLEPVKIREAKTEVKKPALQAPRKANPFLRINQSSKFSSMSELIQYAIDRSTHYQTPNILLIYDQRDFVKEMNCQFLLLKKGGNFDYFYVNHLDDICEKGIMFNEEKKYSRIDSELLQFIKKAKSGDVFGVNWTDYNANHIGHNSIIDQMRELMDVAIKKGVIVFSLLHQTYKQQMREDFSSRHQEILDIAGHIEVVAYKETAVEQNDAMDVDWLPSVQLYQSANWEDKLLGKPELQGNQIIEIQGDLINAINSNLNGLTIINPPIELLSFELFLQTLKYQRYFMFHGKRFELPDGFEINIVSKDVHLQGDVTIHATFSDSLATYSLNAQTWHQFVFSYHHSGGLMRLPGIIESAKGKKIQVYYNDALSLEHWAKIFQLAHLNQVSLRVVVGPEAVLPYQVSSAGISSNIQKGNALAISDIEQLLTHQSNVLYVKTSDIDYLAERIESTHQYDVHPVRPNASSTDIVDNLLKKDGEDDLMFDYIKGPLLESLEAGKWVVLKGTMSPKLANQLETLTLPQPYLWVNGKVYYLAPDSKIIFVSDNDNPFHLLEQTFAMNVTREQMFEQLASIGKDEPALNKLQELTANKPYSISS